MEYFRGFDNQLTGTLPQEFFHHPHMLFFWMENNKFTGTLPPEIESWRMVKEVKLQNNSLTGPIPVGELELLMMNGSLTMLNLTHNSGLYGSLPDTFCYWSEEPESKNILDFDCGPVCGCDCSCDDGGANASSVVVSGNDTSLSTGK